jgi:hypothetical protein
MSQQANFMANVPLMNRQAQLQSAQTYGGLGNSLMSVAPRTQTTNQTSEGTGTGYQQNTSTPSIMSDIGQTVAIAGGVMGMPSGGMTQPTPGFTPPNAGNSSFMAPQNTDFSNMPGMGGGMIQPGLAGGQGMLPWMQGMQPNNLMWNGG